MINAKKKNYNNRRGGSLLFAGDSNKKIVATRSNLLGVGQQQGNFADSIRDNYQRVFESVREVVEKPLFIERSNKGEENVAF